MEKTWNNSLRPLDDIYFHTWLKEIYSMYMYRKTYIPIPNAYMSIKKDCVKISNTQAHEIKIYRTLTSSLLQRCHRHILYKVGQKLTTYLDRLVIGSLITMHSLISPYLVKYSRRPSEMSWNGTIGKQTIFYYQTWFYLC